MNYERDAAIIAALKAQDEKLLSYVKSDLYEVATGLKPESDVNTYGTKKQQPANASGQPEHQR